jgi:hypothetical protein
MSMRGSVNRYLLALTGSRGQGSLHKDVEPIISRLGWPVVGDPLQGRVDKPSLLFADFELPKSIIVGVFIERYIDLNINIDARLEDVTHFPEHQIFGKCRAFGFHMNEFLQDSNGLVRRY